MVDPIESDSPLVQSILSELEESLKVIEGDVKQRGAAKRYLGELLKYYRKPEYGAVAKHLASAKRKKLVSFYPEVGGTLDKLEIDIKRKYEQVFPKLFSQIKAYCESGKIPISGSYPSLVIDSYIDVTADEKKRSINIGIKNVRSLDFDKLQYTIDSERERVWGREFDAQRFRNEIMEIYTELFGSKPSPVGWIPLPDVYQSFKARIERENPHWKKQGRLISYYKDEFSADISKLWKAQANGEIESPHIQFSGIRDPRKSFKIILPDGKVERLGLMRPQERKGE